MQCVDPHFWGAPQNGHFRALGAPAFAPSPSRRGRGCGRGAVLLGAAVGLVIDEALQPSVRVVDLAREPAPVPERARDCERHADGERGHGAAELEPDAHDPVDRPEAEHGESGLRRRKALPRRRDAVLVERLLRLVGHRDPVAVLFAQQVELAAIEEDVLAAPALLDAHVAPRVLEAVHALLAHRAGPRLARLGHVRRGSALAEQVLDRRDRPQANALHGGAQDPDAAAGVAEVDLVATDPLGFERAGTRRAVHGHGG